MARHTAQPEQLRQREEAQAAADALEQIPRSGASAASGGN